MLSGKTLNQLFLTVNFAFSRTFIKGIIKAKVSFFFYNLFKLTDVFFRSRTCNI
jgi:hypothetical protein